MYISTLSVKCEITKRCGIYPLSGTLLTLNIDEHTCACAIIKGLKKIVGSEEKE
jgi:hypothetical protein